MTVVKLRPVPDARTVPVVEGRIESSALFSQQRRVRIAHGDEIYVLTLTSKNRLILTK